MNRLSFLGDMLFGKKEDKPKLPEVSPKPTKRPLKFKQKLIERKRITFQDTGNPGFSESWEVLISRSASTAEATLEDYITFILSQNPSKIVIEAGKNILYDKVFSEDEEDE